ncbi:LysR family transcriptional regulator [Phycicoccus endophyticus]|uniref:LysR family transcriptional regulator n=1 Tax=Phycicoccus endophyticus TaxID=1690220 RepID=A0A7G9QZQ7_9MICO|nr:LysR family transcriptional regulator [Phycicoccus endophyticus]NHI20026.1 LysR family transcriptional regulator [Phycicoccus endophyticus]QNN48832.1 LysR family transcriptional regulator [Phycicoccus endophyticus]GGL42508.1 LysR family transcriptional regulator [Phycicoccus endophyticus]
MERRQLEYFVAVVEHRGFSRAATSLHVSQSTLSRAIQTLERELGTLLFRRTRDGVAVTPAAERLVRQARAVLREIDTLAAVARSSEADIAGAVTVAVTPGPSGEPMARIVAALQARHPAITTVARLVHNPREAFASLDSGTAEVAVMGAPQRPSHSGTSARQVERDELVVALPPGSSLAGLDAIRPEHLVGMPFVVAPYGSTLQQLIDDLDAQTGGLRVVARASHRHAVLPLVARGVGAAILSLSARTSASSAGVTLRSLDPPVLVPTWVCHQGGLSPAAQAFVEVAVNRRNEAD